MKVKLFVTEVEAIDEKYTLGHVTYAREFEVSEEEDRNDEQLCDAGFVHSRHVEHVEFEGFSIGGHAKKMYFFTNLEILEV